MPLTRSDYAREFADPARSDAARRGAVTRENRAKAYRAWLSQVRRDTGREPSPEQIADATERIRREVVR